MKEQILLPRTSLFSKCYVFFILGLIAFYNVHPYVQHRVLFTAPLRHHSGASATYFEMIFSNFSHYGHKVTGGFLLDSTSSIIRCMMLFCYVASVSCFFRSLSASIAMLAAWILKKM